jgi:hypothetical protein
MLRNIIIKMLRKKSKPNDTTDSKAARKFYNKYLKSSDVEEELMR